MCVKRDPSCADNALWLRASANDNFMACAPLAVRLSGCKHPSSALATSTCQPCAPRLQHSSFCCAVLLATHCALHKPRNRTKAKRTLRTGMGTVFGRSDAEEIQTYFRGKIIWVTGASGGFGEALCVALCQSAQPEALLISARRKEELQRVRSKCMELSPSVKVGVVPMDLEDISSLPEIAKTAKASFGRVDILVNNGGVGFRGLGQETSIDVDQRVMNIDFFGGVALVKALLPDWLDRQTGHVVQVSSVQGFFGLPGRTAYAAAKHAAVGFYDSLRAEVAESGVSVTTVCPGYIATGHSQNALRGEGVKYPEGHTSKGVRPELLAPKVLAAVARRKPELVPAALDARLARILRTCCPNLLFWIMKRRARKEARERSAATDNAAIEGKKLF